MNIAFVVLHYKHVFDTINCLHSIKGLKRLSSEGNLRDEVIIVDNDPASRIEKNDIEKVLGNTSYKLLRNDKNIGFAGGVNRGIREALLDHKVKYVVVLNNDVVLPDTFLDICNNPTGVTGPVIQFHDVHAQIVYDYGGVLNRWTGRTRHEESKKARKQESRKNIEIDYVSGCCMVINRAVIEKIGLFDERFFFYFEDVDYCLRAKQKGFAVEVETGVVAYHKLAASIGRWSNRAILYMLASNAIFISKHLGWRRPIGYGYLALLAMKIVFDKVRNLL